MRKELSLFSVYAIATGTTLSAGFFLLPGLAAVEAGPAMILCYLIAAVPMVPAMFSIIELATAMPRSGGAYYFLDRSLGPLLGTIGGFGTWAALVLKTAFALVGMGAYMALILPESVPPEAMKLLAAGFAILFGIINLLGAKKSGRAQIYLVIGLLGILAWFVGKGSFHVNTTHFEHFFGSGVDKIIATSGMVYISYVGVTKIASVSEEVKNPERNLPLGVFLSFGTTILIYATGTFVMVGVIAPHDFLNDYTPVASVAGVIAGKWGVYLISIAALMAFSSVANAGILSASRYPLAMARDHLLPAKFRSLSARGTPFISIVVTVAVILVLLFLEPIKIAKLASAFQLLMFAMLCFAVIVMRESRIDSYDPGFKSPFYPWMQIIGIVIPFWFIAEMGWLAIVLTIGLVGLGAGWYFYYARSRVERHGAIFHVFARLGQRRYEDLDKELRVILKEKGLRTDDPFDAVVAQATFSEAPPSWSFEEVVNEASKRLSIRIPCEESVLIDGFMEGTRVGATPVTGGIALPHLRVPGIERPMIALVRSRSGLTVTTNEAFGEAMVSESIHAIFFLVSPEHDPGQHLRLLARLAERVDEADFLAQWLKAENEQQVKETLFQQERFLSVTLETGSPAGPYINQTIGSLSLPEDCLIVLIHRMNEIIIPLGGTVLRENDRLTIIGTAPAVESLKEELGYTAEIREIGE